jgi:hypothetical protein
MNGVQDYSMVDVDGLVDDEQHCRLQGSCCSDFSAGSDDRIFAERDITEQPEI